MDFKTIRNRFMRAFVLCLLTLATTQINAQTPGFDSLKNKAKLEQKNILLYFSGSDWCAPCIKFKTNYIAQPVFQEYSNRHLLLYNADFPRKKANQLSKEKTLENEQLAERYNPAGMFPSIVLMDHTGKIIKRWDALPKESVSDFINALQN